MTGVLNAVVGQPGGLRYTVTVGNAGNSYGFDSAASQGSISSTSFLGRTIVAIESNTGGGGLALSVALNYTGSDLPTNFFQAVWVQCTDGTWKTYRTSDVTVFSLNIWSWDTSGARPWTGTSPSTRAVILVP